MPANPAAGVTALIESVSVFDVDALAEAVRSSHFEHLQIECGDFRAELKRINLGRLLIDSGCYTRKVIARGDFPPGCTILGCLLDNNEEGYINGYRFRRNDVVIFPEGSELDYIQPAGSSWCAIPLPGNLIEETGIEEKLPGKVTVLQDQLALARLLNDLVNSHTPRPGKEPTGFTPPLPDVEDLLLDRIRHVLNDCIDDSIHLRRPSLHERMSLVRQFESILEGRNHTQARISDLCTELGVSMRLMEYVFKEEIGMTPKQYTNVLRIRAVRQELLRASDENLTVAKVTRRFGIHHPGRFAAAYQRQYGEFPADTLRQSRQPKKVI